MVMVASLSVMVAKSSTRRPGGLRRLPEEKGGLPGTIDPHGSIAHGMEDSMKAEQWGEHPGGEHPHMDVTEAIIGAAIKVQKALGPGLLLNFRTWPLKDGGIKRVINAHLLREPPQSSGPPG